MTKVDSAEIGKAYTVYVEAVGKDTWSGIFDFSLWVDVEILEILKGPTYEISDEGAKILELLQGTNGRTLVLIRQAQCTGWRRLWHRLKVLHLYATFFPKAVFHVAMGHV